MYPGILPCRSALQQKENSTKQYKCKTFSAYIFVSPPCHTSIMTITSTWLKTYRLDISSPGLMQNVFFLGLWILSPHRQAFSKSLEYGRYMNNYLSIIYNEYYYFTHQENILVFRVLQYAIYIDIIDAKEISVASHWRTTTKIQKVVFLK